MATTSFIALQCYSCSTMQVKQKKKSSNKWICVVCNEKQSVRKVFYEAFAAKDVRFYVQDSNMSRQYDDENKKKRTLIEGIVGDYDKESFRDGESNRCLGKRRNDWSEYLDPEIETEDGQDKGCELEPEFVTELPKEILKRPKLKNYSAGLKRSRTVKSYNPVSSSEKRDIPIIATGTSKLCSDEVTYKGILAKNLNKPKMTFQTELCINKVTCNEISENRPKMAFQAETTKRASKWAEYLTDEDNDYLFKGTDENSTENLFEMPFNDQKVEEDLHPDFL